MCQKARYGFLGPFSPSFNVTEWLRSNMERTLPENAHEIVELKCSQVNFIRHIFRLPVSSTCPWPRCMTARTWWPTPSTRGRSWSRSSSPRASSPSSLGLCRRGIGVTGSSVSHFWPIRPLRLPPPPITDGGYSDNCPVLDSSTITVSPFAGTADICPQGQLPGSGIPLSVSAEASHWSIDRMIASDWPNYWLWPF